MLCLNRKKLKITKQLNVKNKHQFKKKSVKYVTRKAVYKKKKLFMYLLSHSP